MASLLLGRDASSAGRWRSSFFVLNSVARKRSQSLQNRNHLVTQRINARKGGKQRSWKSFRIDWRRPVSAFRLPPTALRHHLLPPLPPAIQRSPSHGKALLKAAQSLRAWTVPKDRQQQYHYTKKYLTAQESQRWRCVTAPASILSATKTRSHEVLTPKRCRPPSRLAGVLRAVKYTAAWAPLLSNFSGQILVEPQQHLKETRIVQQFLVQGLPPSVKSTQGDAPSSVLSTQEGAPYLLARPSGADDYVSGVDSNHVNLWEISQPITNRDQQRLLTHRLS